MKTLAIFILLMASLSISAQKPLDTIFVNEKMNVALFFPKPIRQGITGTENFVFTYNREKEQYFGLLQAKPGEMSNLLVITKEGHVYSYVLEYAEHLSKLNYFISTNEIVGNEKPQVLNCTKVVLKQNPEDAYLKSFSDYLLKLKLAPISSKRNDDIRLNLLKLAYHKDKVYLILEIKNKSKIDFEINDLTIHIANLNKGRKSSLQALNQPVIYQHNLPRFILGHESSRFVSVLPKFVLGKHEKLIINVHEMKGSRNVTLETKL
jgi:hypothetical protein